MESTSFRAKHNVVEKSLSKSKDFSPENSGLRSSRNDEHHICYNI